MQAKKLVVLTFIHYYLPGYKSGGPVRTIANMVEKFGDEIEFRIITLDRDIVDIQPYPSIRHNEWNKVGKAYVYYISPAACSSIKLILLIQRTPHDIVYLNSFFDPVFAIYPLLIRWLQLTPECPWIIAPRGEFSEGALMLKHWKKYLFIATAEKLRIYRDLVWQASSEYEAVDIENNMGASAKKIIVVQNLPAEADYSTPLVARLHQSDEPLRVIFLSRISPMKNLDFALRVLGRVHSSVIFSIYGPVGEDEYWDRCQRLINGLPTHIKVTYAGSVEPARVPSVMALHDLFFLPTLGENYGHVIAEALSAGTPVLISNTTPWRNLELEGVGWDLPLDEEQPYAECIDHCAGLNSETYREWRSRVQRYAYRRLNDPNIIEVNRALFMKATGRIDGLA